MSKFLDGILDFVRGMGNVLCIFPSNINIEPKRSEDGMFADAEAIQSDWQAVGDDIRKVMNEVTK